MAKIEGIAANQIGRWNIILHPGTGAWMLTTEVSRAKSSVRSCHETNDIRVKLENGETLSFADHEEVIRKE